MNFIRCCRLHKQFWLFFNVSLKMVEIWTHVWDFIVSFDVNYHALKFLKPWLIRNQNTIAEVVLRNLISKSSVVVKCFSNYMSFITDDFSSVHVGYGDFRIEISTPYWEFSKKIRKIALLSGNSLSLNITCLSFLILYESLLMCPLFQLRTV